jgi:RNA polymerase sigma factor (sigma-70 family)
MDVLTEKIEGYSKIFKPYCLKVASDPYEAEEVFQEGLIKLCKLLKEEPEKYISKRYLYKMAQSVFYDFKRNENLQKNISTASETAARLNDSSVEVHDLLQTLLNRLSPQQLAIFLLIEEMKLTIRETASVLRTSEGAVKALLYRSRQNIKKIKDDVLEGEVPVNLEEPHTFFIEELSKAILKGDPLAICQAYVKVWRSGLSFVEVERKMGGFSFYFRDPDGHLIKIFSVF